jgi:hypothetical protein
VAGFITLQTEATIQKILLLSWVVKGKIAAGNSLDSQAQFEDLGLKYCIEEENDKNTLSGRNLQKSLDSSMKIRTKPCPILANSQVHSWVVNALC